MQKRRVIRILNYSKLRACRGSSIQILERSKARVFKGSSVQRDLSIQETRVCRDLSIQRFEYSKTRLFKQSSIQRLEHCKKFMFSEIFDNCQHLSNHGMQNAFDIFDICDIDATMGCKKHSVFQRFQHFRH